MAENNYENRARLIAEVIDTWDMDDLVLFAKRHLHRDYVKDTDMFDEDWESLFGEDDDGNSDD